MTEWRSAVWRGKAVDGYSVSDDGRVIGRRGRELTLQFDDGRPRVMMSPLHRTVPVHVLVCETFHGPKPTPKHEVAHGDGDPENNRADNLRWATHVENSADMKWHGTLVPPPGLRGEQHPSSKLTWADVREIRFMHTWGFITQRELARRYGISDMAMSNLLRRRNWRNDPNITIDQDRKSVV